MVYQLSHDEN